MTYTIPRIPPSNNQYMGRTNRWEYQTAKKEWATLIQYCCTPKPKKPIEKAVVHIQYFFPDKRRRDPDNYSGKFILDGLVSAGILQDDSFQNIQLVLSADLDREKPRTVVTIEEL